MIELLLACALCSTAPVDTTRVTAQDNDDVDHWVGTDKLKHFSMSYAITAFGYAGARPMFDRETSLAAAVTGAAAAGLLKEVYDRKRGHPFSLRDIIYDAAGIAAAYIMVKQTQ